MLAIVSPAKNLDFETPPVTKTFTQLELVDDATELANVCKKLTPQDLSSLMGISDKLAGLNAARFEQWTPEFTLDNSKQAVLAFNGDVYSGLDAPTLTNAQLNYAQDHLRILSGLYGLLKPLDLIKPYRLEMGKKLANPRGDNLYEFWGDIITDKVNEALAQSGTDILVNLASNEYFKSVRKKQVKGQIITPIFKDEKNGKLKVISFYAKKARGLMARYIIENKVKTTNKLQEFNVAGYQFDQSLSKAGELVFTRPEQV
ncbi:peroxide stress protein YaaA [Flocculibacter collagenilyticus]|uniref:peroxide stress protein YaaA n=1 Tax=Flocculibacter collagenilyticus TaxID=2744479 RepID=UPI0018F55A84|nr:peroxide stress protein YaaA [Flocculibacter collagenilyticus]